MSDSAFTRFWNSVKPPVDNRPGSGKAIELRRRQRRLITVTVAVVALICAGGGVYYYVSNAPVRADREFQLGMSLMGPNKYLDAITHFNRALAISSQLPNAYLERGNAERILGQPDAALADYQSAADLNPSLAPAHNGIALIYLERHDQRHALEELSKSIALQPTVEGYYQRGQILETQGDHQKAIEDYDRAIAEERDAPFVYRARALSKANLGDEEGARQDRLLATQIEHR